VLNFLHLVFSPPESSVLYTGTYDPVLVSLSVVVAILASYASLMVSQHVLTIRSTKARRLWFVGGGLCLGLGIWAMHFVGMLAFSLPCTSNYDPTVTFLSMIPSIIASTIAIKIISRSEISRAQLATGGLLIGAGIGGMHYSGMAAMHLNGMIRYDIKLFLLSILVAVVLATLALWIKFRLQSWQTRWNEWGTIVSATVMGLAVSGMHYTAMAAAYFIRDGDTNLATSGISPAFLAVIVLAATCLIIVVTIVATYAEKSNFLSFRQSFKLIGMLIVGWGIIAWLSADYYYSYRSSQMYQHETPYAKDQTVRIGNNNLPPVLSSQILPEDAVTIYGLRHEFVRLGSEKYWLFLLLVTTGSMLIITVAAVMTYLREAQKAAAENRIAATAFESQEGMMITNVKNEILRVNHAFTAITGYTAEETIGQTPRILKSGRYDADFFATMWNSIVNAGVWEGEIWNRRKNGEEFPGHLIITAVKDTNGSIANYVGTFSDISERKRVEEALLITASVFENCQEAIMIADANNSIMDVNPAFIRITGYTREEVIGKNPKLLSSGRQDKAFYSVMWQTLNQEKNWRGEIWNQRKSGESYAELLSISAICDNDGNVLRYVGVFSDISHIKEHEAELRHVAHYDVLTGIPNRVLLADRMKQAIAQTSREQNMMAVCYLDLDGFKPINDTMGHDAGDQVLIEVAKRIENTIRGGDTVARLGGDEFVVLLLGLEKGEECVATLERLLAAIAQPITIKNKSSAISASIGVSIYPLDDEDPDTLLRHADQAMYQAKQSGRNRFHIYDPTLDRRARDQHEFMKSIHDGLENDQFELFYQPKINLRTKELVGAEALIRWRHPERGLLPPAEFLRYIENTDLDIEIGEWVTATALAQMNHWRNAGLDIEVSINISGYHLESSNFFERLQQQLAQYPDMPFGKFQIEVLETVALNEIAIVKGVIESCRNIGVGFALDDFGTGYSSLSYLSGLPVDVLKIDQSFVRDMLGDKGDMAIVQGIIALARAFDRQTVAEGIETVDHYQILLDMGCELGQGYYIARPMPADELTNWRVF
jgi:diguanylate cyclase (GGDEF)-like protein/PAS domain S-box-containing protein